MIKKLNSNSIKFIAIISMIIDHADFAFFDNNIIMRIIGRLSFPLFAYFIAEGYVFTSNRKKYLKTLLLYSLISQIPYMLLFSTNSLNTLFTYVFSLAIIMIYENITVKNKDNSVFNMSIIMLMIFILLILDIFNMISYGVLGVLIPIVFYFYRDYNIKYVFFLILNALISLVYIANDFSVFYNYIQLFAGFSIFIMNMYNGKRGELKYKNIFYIIYPVHIFLFYLIAVV